MSHKSSFAIPIPHFIISKRSATKHLVFHRKKKIHMGLEQHKGQQMNYSCRMFCKISLLKWMTLSLERIFVSFCCPPVVLKGTIEAVQHYFSYCFLLVSFRNEFEVHQTR